MICPNCGDKSCKVCAECGIYECVHHAFVPLNRPSDRCVCNTNEWIDPSNIPPVCDTYIGDGTNNCTTCEHDQECHVPNNRPNNKCVCNTTEWVDPSNIPTVCDKYSGDGTDNCTICEHNKNCHTPSK